MTSLLFPHVSPLVVVAMLEILLLVWLCSSLGKILRSKGRKPLVFQIMLVISWFGAQVAGFFVGGIVRAVRGEEMGA